MSRQLLKYVLTKHAATTPPAIPDNKPRTSYIGSLFKKPVEKQPSTVFTAPSVNTNQHPILGTYFNLDTVGKPFKRPYEDFTDLKHPGGTPLVQKDVHALATALGEQPHLDLITLNAAGDRLPMAVLTADRSRHLALPKYTPREVAYHELAHVADPVPSTAFKGDPKDYTAEKEAPSSIVETAAGLAEGWQPRGVNPNTWQYQAIKKYGPKLVNQLSADPNTRSSQLAMDAKNINKFVKDLRSDTPLGRTYRQWVESNKNPNANSFTTAMLSLGQNTNFRKAIVAYQKAQEAKNALQGAGAVGK